MSLNAESLLTTVKEVREKSKKRNFPQSFELIVNLKDIDVKKPENRIQTVIELPYMLGKENKVCVIASGELALNAKKKGADLVVEREELEAMAGNKERQKELADSYDFFIAEAPLMPLIGKVLGSTLGPKGKMPTPVPPKANIAEHIKKQRKAVRLRVRGQPNLQCLIGTEKMSDDQIVQNVQTVMKNVEGKLKKGLKNIKSICLKTSMGKPVKIKP